MSRFLVAISAVALIAAGESDAGVFISLRPSILDLQSAQIGYRGKGRVSPVVSVAYGMVNINHSYEYHDSYDSSENSSSYNLHVVIPSAGIRLYLTDKNGLQTYLCGSLMYATPAIVQSVTDGERDYDNEKDIREWISALGLNGGIGLEYFFSKAFSISGELLLNVFADKAKNTYRSEDGTYYSESINGGIFALTRTSISLNFYL